MESIEPVSATGLGHALERLDGDALVAFAGACAERQLFVERGTDPRAASGAEALLEELWRHLLGHELSVAELERIADHAERCGMRVLAEAFRCASTHDPVHAQRAARESVIAELERQTRDVEQLLVSGAH